MTTYEVTERVVNAARGEFLTLATMDRDEFGGWHRVPSTHYLREGDCVFQCRIFGRNVLTEKASSEMCDIFDRVPMKTHSELAADIKAMTLRNGRPED